MFLSPVAVGRRWISIEIDAHQSGEPQPVRSLRNVQEGVQEDSAGGKIEISKKLAQRVMETLYV